MKTIIIASGHCGTTVKAAKILSEMLGGADVFDTLDKTASLDFSAYDNYIFGANMRIFMLNGRFKAWARKLQRHYKDKKVYGYLVGCMEENEKGLAKLSKKLPGNGGVVYAWGEFVTENVSGQTAQMYKDMKNECLQKGKALPHLREDELCKLAALCRK